MIGKLGKHPRRDDPRTLSLAKYLAPAVSYGTPATVIPPTPPRGWGMLGNDVYGDCTVAACAHQLMAWRLREKVKKRPPSTRTVLTLYNRVNGGVDQGAVCLDVLNAWRHKGLGKDKITAYAAIHPTDHTSVKNAAWLFGGVYIGLNLPLTAQTDGTWDVVSTTGDGAPGSWGGHAVSVCGYDDQGVTVVTWGEPKLMTWRFWDSYTDESYAIFSKTDWLGDVPGFDQSALLSDLQRL